MSEDTKSMVVPEKGAVAAAPLPTASSGTAPAQSVELSAAKPVTLKKPPGFWETTFGEISTHIGVMWGGLFVTNEVISIVGTDCLEHRQDYPLSLIGWSKTGYEAAAHYLHDNVSMFADSYKVVNDAAKIAELNAAQALRPGYKLLPVAEGVQKWAKFESGLGSAKNLLMTTGLLMGGTLLVVPAKIALDHKAEISTFLNHSLDTARSYLGLQTLSKEQIAKRDEEVNARVAAEPHQTWPSILTSRAIAAGVTYAFSQLVMGKRGNDAVRDFGENHVIVPAISAIGGKQAADNYLAKSPADSRGRSWGQLLGVETACCAVSASAMEVGCWFTGVKSETPAHETLHGSAAGQPPAAADVPVLTTAAKPASDVPVPEVKEARFASPALAAKKFATVPSTMVERFAIPAESHSAALAV